MKRILKIGTLESKIYSVFIILIFSTILIIQVVTFRFTLETVRTSIHATNRTLLGQLVEQIDSYIAGMDLISKTVTEQQDVQLYLSSTQNRSEEAKAAIQDRLLTYLTVRDDVSDIMIVSAEDVFISSEPDAKLNPNAKIAEKNWYTRAVRTVDKAVISTAYVQNIIMGEYPWVVSLSRGIVSNKDQSLLGVLLIDLKFNRIKSLCQSFTSTKKGYNFIIDKNGNYIYHPSMQLIYSDLYNEPIGSILGLLDDTQKTTYSKDNRYYIVETSDLTGWHVVNVTYEGDMITDWRYVHMVFTLVGLVLFIFIGITTKNVSLSITKPVRKLLEVMKGVDRGEFKLVGNIRAGEEIRELAREYDIMVGKIRELIAANKREQEQKRKSDLKALQAQINPHFLYNTLDSIIWMAEMNQSDKVVQMTSALSKLFRISISKGQDMIPIRDEIAHVESYLKIQQMRYRDKFDYKLDIDPLIYDYIILKITLQPLVENSIYHGIKEIEEKGKITIAGYLEDDHIIMKVADNGKGMTREQLIELRHEIDTAMEDRSADHRHGMGVRNVHQRIRIHFGGQYGIYCSSERGDGTMIQVKIPRIERGE